MADEIITKQELIDAKPDVKNLGEAANGNETGIVTPRYGEPYLTAPAAIKKIIDAGGFRPFSTEVELKAYTPTSSPVAAYAFDTKKVWLWKQISAEGIEPKVFGWIDEGTSALDQAKDYSDFISSFVATYKSKTFNLPLSSYDDLNSGLLFIDRNKKVFVSIDSNGQIISQKKSVKNYKIPLLSFSEIIDPKKIIFSDQYLRYISLTDNSSVEKQIKSYKTPLFSFSETKLDRVYFVDKDFRYYENPSAQVESIKTRLKKYATNKLSIYQKGQNKNYIEFNFERQIYAFDGSTDPNNMDCWRINQCYECDEFFNRIRSIANNGAWECAIKEASNTPDFVGTFHGDDVLTEAYFFVNGIYYDQDSIFDITNFNQFSFVQKGDLYHCNTQTKHAAYVRHYEWHNVGFTLQQSLKWLDTSPIRTVFAAMIPIRRKVNDNDTGDQITDTILRSYKTETMLETRQNYDSSEPSVKTVFGKSGIAKVWSKISGISAGFEVLEATELPGANFTTVPRLQYNKLYYDVVGMSDITDSYSPSVNETWTYKVKFNVSTSN
ncbi:hypothetical protein [Acinetobacter soli]|uniref:Uncharacterized protein n=1 Tax=Acinetobacter soli NIPH 2899 TaxID=1217677 RepID=A0ABN0JXP0_9GAMM|nr:hypothetical protein [Acinetobacter soli]ENV60377.1 hypothetical protein F950_02939 [Acinetobacter soli NIPH 2899]